MFHNKFIKLAIAAAALGAAIPQAFAQGTTTLFDPYLPGTQLTAPLVPAVGGPIPAVGCGPTPWPVTPGMAGSAALMPWVPSIPSNSIDQGFTGLSLPLGGAALTPPGVLGPALSGFIPPPSSAPGPIPSYLQSPGSNFNPAEQVAVPQSGILPGTGGYYTTINKVRRSGQKTTEFERKELPSILGGGGIAQDEVTEMGALAGWGIPFGIPTGVGYNNGPAGSNNDLYQTSVDLGGGQRMKIGGTNISTGQTIQDYGSSVLRHTPIGALTAQQSTEFGQGLHGSGIYTNKTTDFGCKFAPWNTANIGVDDNVAARENPIAVETNF
ncbi:MAG: hypothetical protein P4L53_25110 [Candidatus Obscuribacterales bacterium]|nr:hypothetical protein [Candidatus Obscuribacterales bacterium]